MRVRQRVRNLLGKMNDDDRSALVGLLVKSGYAVRIGRERVGSKGRVAYFVEYWEEEDAAEGTAKQEDGTEKGGGRHDQGRT